MEKMGPPVNGTWQVVVQTITKPYVTVASKNGGIVDIQPVYVGHTVVAGSAFDLIETVLIEAFKIVPAVFLGIIGNV